MDNRQKLQRMLARLSNFDSGVSGAFKSVELEMQRVVDKIREEAQVQTVDETRKRMKELKSEVQFAVDSLVGAFNNLKSELGQNEKKMIGTLEMKIKDFVLRVDSLKIDKGQLDSLTKALVTLQVDLQKVRDRKIEMPDFTPRITEVEARLRDEIKKLKDTRPEDRSSTFNNRLDTLEKEIMELRKRTLSAMSHGGQANRNISVGGNSSTLSRYTDINLKAGTNVTLAYANNDVLKTTDLTITASGGSSNIASDTFTSTGGNQAITLSQTPVTVLSINLNGQALYVTDDYTLVGVTLTLTNPQIPSGLKGAISYTY